jgi:hypothetical protein
MAPEEIRAAARAARHGDQVHAFDDTDCSAFAIVASSGSVEYARMNSNFQSAADRARKRKLAAVQDDTQVPVQAPEGLPDDTEIHEDSGNDEDFLSALGV